jgi:3-phenylpropionate/cinnamic acid dioxygenase small subunit
LTALDLDTTSSDGALFARVASLYAAAAEAICDGRLLEWPEFFVDTAQYSVISRVNYDRGLPLSSMFYETKGALVDRITAIKNTMVYAPRYITHLIGSIAIVDRSESALRTRSSFATYQTLVDGDPQLFMVGRTFDELHDDGTHLLFAKRVVVFDSERLPGSIVYPI